MSLNRMVAAALAAVGVVGLSNAALGADMPIKMSTKALTNISYNWTGFYLGVQGGYGWDKGSTTHSPIDPFFADFFTPPFLDGEIPATSSLTSKGFLGGIEGGYNHQYGQAVFGLEADFSYSGIRGSTTSVSPQVGATPSLTTADDKKLEWFGTLRGRLGFLPAPSVLAFVTGGLAYGKTVASTTTTAYFASPGNDFDCSTNFFTCTAGSTSSVRAGWTLGAGFESFIARNWSVKAEYLYYDLGHVSYTNTETHAVFGNAPVMQTDVHFNGSIARVGLNYQFN
ncbi:MAG TPA: outer membrane beta-barrel protein [Pseudolabrys sp.]